MPVVSNTSPVLNLAVIDRLALLSDRFGQVWVPPAVLKELRPEEDLRGSRAVRGAREAGWLQIKAVEDEPLVQVLRRELDQGEAEAIALALQVNVEWMLLDERLPSLQEAMEQLREKAGFHIQADLFADLLKKSGETKT